MLAPMSPFREHRRALLARLAAAGTAAVVPTATRKVRNHDSEYRFRPDSDFWYLTGFAEPEATLVLLPDLSGGEEHRALVFLRERDPEREVWDGARLGVAAAAEALGLDEARPSAALWTDLAKLLAGYESVLWPIGRDEAADRRMLETLVALRRNARGLVRPPVELLDPLPYLHELRLLKDPAELACMRRAAALSAEGHRAAMAAARPGASERELDALLEYTFRRRGGTGCAYTNIVAGGANACILHYNANDAELRAGELVLVDAGAEFDYYASDVTRTFPVGGRFTDDQRALYEIVLEAQLAAVAAVRPGVAFDALHRVALERLVDGMVRIGLLAGEREALIESGAYRRFYMHRTSHWLGLDVHDCGYYAVAGESRELEPGMVLTVEPGLYVPPGDASVDARWRGVGVRIEDDVLVTEDGCEVLTAAVPKSVAEVEAACGAELALA